MSYTAIVRLKAKPGDTLGTWKPSKAFDASSRCEAITAAFDWKDKNVADGYEVQELWLSESSGKAMLWQVEEVELNSVENISV